MRGVLASGEQRQDPHDSRRVNERMPMVPRPTAGRSRELELADTSSSVRATATGQQGRAAPAGSGVARTWSSSTYSLGFHEECSPR